MTKSKDSDYYNTYQDEIPDDLVAAEYIYGTHTGFQDKEIPELVRMIKMGEIPEKIMRPLRVLALNCHNGFIRYNIALGEGRRMEDIVNEHIEELEADIQKLKSHALDMTRIVLNSEKRGR